jgi:imidazolonepropionase-like amidohydrolase
MKIIRNATLYQMDGLLLADQDIRIEEGRITEIGSKLDVKDAEIIDADGALLFPGFIDAHCHLGMWEDGIGFEGADGNEAVDPVTPHMRAIDGINPMDRTFEEARNGGVTACATGPGSANVIGGTFAAIKTAGNRIDKMIIQDPLAMKCAFGENPKRVYNGQKKTPMTRMGTAATLRDTLFKAKEYWTKKDANQNDPAKQPAFDMKLESLGPVIKKVIPLKAHAHRADDIFSAIRIAKEFDLGLTLDHCTEGHLIADELALEGYPALVGPSLSERSKFELKNLTFETPGILYKAGMKIAIITDSPVIPLQYLPLCAALATKHGLSKEEAIKAITINAAEILGLEDRIGSIEVGKDADLVLWDKHPFHYESQVLMTIINGDIVYKA